MVQRVKRHQIEGLPPAFDVVDYGAKVDGVTDDTAAWQAAINAAAAVGGGRVVCSRTGVSIIAGALQDTSGANAQLLLPAVDYVDSENISIVIEGAVPPPATFSVIGATPLPDNHLVIKSTLTSGSGGALLGGQGPAGTFQNFTNVDLTLRNVAFRMPSNPTHTALNLLKVSAVDLDHVVVDCGGYYVEGLTTPTTSASYAIKLPDINNGAHVRLGAVDVIGFYNGYLFNEHSQGEQVAAWGCNKAFVFAGGYHASKFQRLMAVHCPRGMVFVGGSPNPHYVDVDQFDVEHAASGAFVTVYDIDDASNYGHGKVKWHVVLGGTGVDTTFTVNGATGISASRVGTEVTPGIAVQDEGAAVASGVTQLDFQGAGVTATSGSGEVVVTIPGVYREVLMASGVSFPADPLESSAGSDWLYGEVS